MSVNSTIPISFGGLSLTMAPFFKENTEEIESVKVVISYTDSSTQEVSILYDFILGDSVKEIDTKKLGRHSTDVKGNMYLDYNKEKVIFEGSYSEDNYPKDRPFWLEVTPDPAFFILNKSSKVFELNDVTCPPYPASVGSVAFDMSPAVTAMDDTMCKNDFRNNVNFEVMQINPKAKTEKTRKVTYLSAILSENKKITGIDTSNIYNIHDNDFTGDAGISRKRVYIDGNLKTKDVTCSGFYLEIGI